MISNQNLRVFWKPMNLQDCVWENHYQIIMKTILQEKETIHCSITIWNTNLFLCLKQWRFPQQRQHWISNGKRFRRGTWQKSEAKKEWSMKQGRRAQKFILPHWWTSVIWKMLNWRQSTKNTKVELHSEVILWKTIRCLMQYSLNKDLQRLKWQPQKSWISSSDCQVAMDKQRTVSAYTQIKMEDAPKLLKIPKSESPDIWIRLPRHKWPPVVLLERNLYGHPLARLLWESQFEKVLLKHGWEKVPNWEWLFVNREELLFFFCVYGRDKINSKETEHQSDVGNTFERSRFWRAHIISWPCLFELHSKRMSDKQGYSW